MHGLLRRRAIGSTRPTAPRPRPCSPSRASARPTSTAPSPSWSAREGIQVRTIVGINDDGVFGTSREGWHPDLPDACNEPFVPLLWLKVHGAARPRARGQHRAVPPGRHAAGLTRRHSRRRGLARRRSLQDHAGSRPLRQLREHGVKLRVVPSRVWQPERHHDVRHDASSLQPLTFDPHVRRCQHQQAAILAGSRGPTFHWNPSIPAYHSTFTLRVRVTLR